MSALFSPTALVVPFENLRMTDVEAVGGKNASLGEMISQLPQGVRVPTGFATTAHAFREFLAYDGLADKISAKLKSLDTEDVRALAQVGAEIRAMVEAQPFPADLQKAIADEFAKLSAGNPAASFAVRSSATAEDLPEALQRGRLAMDPARHQVTWAGRAVSLTVTEFLILEALAQRPGVVKTRNQLIEFVGIGHWARKQHPIQA
mgnify:CR=1 FL=1